MSCVLTDWCLCATSCHIVFKSLHKCLTFIKHLILQGNILSFVSFLNVMLLLNFNWVVYGHSIVWMLSLSLSKHLVLLADDTPCPLPTHCPNTHMHALTSIYDLPLLTNLFLFCFVERCWTIICILDTFLMFLVSWDIFGDMFFVNL